MKNRPFLFLLIAFFHLVEPLIKLAYFKATTPFSFGTIISNIAQIHSTKEMIEFWLLFPIAGLALLGVKRWSYPIFVGVQIYNIYGHMTYEKYTWPYVSEIPFASGLILLFINSLIIIYFALPDVRRPFFDKSVRWWETRTRYTQSIPITFHTNNPRDIMDGVIENISETGVFINHKNIIDVGSELKINLNYKDHSMTIKGHVVAHHAFKGQRGMGVQFDFENIWEKLYIRKIVRDVKREVKKQEKLSMVPIA